MRFTFTVTVEVERVEGKFASRDDIVEVLIAEIEGADPSLVDGVGADGTSVYDVIEWEVSS